MKADVSVVMPLYNAKDYVKLAVDSILNQTLAGIELLIVDDCSTDGSLELCRELYGHDKRVRIIQQPKNMGPGAARNTGIRSATGDYVTFVDMLCRICLRQPENSMLMSYISQNSRMRCLMKMGKCRFSLSMTAYLCSEMTLTGMLTLRLRC